LFFVIFAMTQVIFPIIKLPEKNDPLKKTYGYKELAAKVDSLYSVIPDKSKIFFASRHYQMASLLSFYSKSQPQYYVLLDHEASKNYRFWDAWKTKKGSNCLFVYTDSWESAEMSKFFQKKAATYEIDVAIPGKSMRKYYMDLFSGLK
jgi:hypothetical protein